MPHLYAVPWIDLAMNMVVIQQSDSFLKINK
jgi:hypothetical protein